jgi:hypothetical protein
MMKILIVQRRKNKIVRFHLEFINLKLINFNLFQIYFIVHNYNKSKMAKSFLESLFGKKKVVRRRKTSRKTTRKVVKKPSKALRKQAKKYGVKATVKRGSKRVYKSEKVLKKQIKRAMKIHKRKKARLAKKKKSRKTVKRKTRRTKRRVSRRKTAFGVSGRYVPLASIMSSYPRSVNSGSPWI